MGFDIFLMRAVDNPLLFVSVVFTVIVSITLHELAHGWMAIRLGDDTPIRADRMTVNPVVHMGPWALLALALVGIAWGRMPIDRGRLRGRYGESWVALAGPATNLLLSVAALTGVGLWARFEPAVFGPAERGQEWIGRAGFFVQTFGMTNLLLCVFNLLPLPPLDGSHVAANLSRGYDRFVNDPSNSGTIMMMFIFAFVFAGVLFGPVRALALQYIGLLSGAALTFGAG